MNPRIEDRGNYIEIVDFYHSLDDERAGNLYNCSFDIRVRSGGFSGRTDGCEYDYKEWKRFIESLEQLISFEIKKVSEDLSARTFPETRIRRSLRAALLTSNNNSRGLLRQSLFV